MNTVQTSDNTSTYTIISLTFSDRVSCLCVNVSVITGEKAKYVGLFRHDCNKITILNKKSCSGMNK